MYCHFSVRKQAHGGNFFCQFLAKRSALGMCDSRLLCLQDVKVQCGGRAILQHLSLHFAR